MFKTLTDKQQKLFNFIKISTNQNGYQPSVREMCSFMEVRSTNAVYDMLKLIEKKGYIHKSQGKSRAILILK